MMSIVWLIAGYLYNMHPLSDAVGFLKMVAFVFIKLAVKSQIYDCVWQTQFIDIPKAKQKIHFLSKFHFFCIEVCDIDELTMG